MALAGSVTRRACASDVYAIIYVSLYLVLRPFPDRARVCTLSEDWLLSCALLTVFCSVAA